MTDIDRIGGVPVVMKTLLDAGLLHGDCLTVTGRTMAENLEALNAPQPDGTVIRALANPIHATGGITVLHGSLAPEGAVVKSAGSTPPCSPAPPGSSTASRGRWTRSRTAPSPPATSW